MSKPVSDQIVSGFKLACVVVVLLVLLTLAYAANCTGG